MGPADPAPRLPRGVGWGASAAYVECACGARYVMRDGRLRHDPQSSAPCCALCARRCLDCGAAFPDREHPDQVRCADCLTDLLNRR